MPERHKLVLDANCSRIADAYLTALRRGDDRPVVAIIDINDPFARQMAQDLLPHDLVLESENSDEEDDIGVSCVWALPHDQALRQLGNLSPKGRASIEQLTSLDLVPVVVVTDGLLFWAGLPKPYFDPPRIVPRFSEN
jgi:hypothetical protein